MRITTLLMAMLLATIAPIALDLASASRPAVAQAAASRHVVLLPNIGGRHMLTSASRPKLSFGVYPGGGTGETPDAPNPDPSAVDRRLSELSGGRRLLVHLYTAWSWHDQAYLDREIRRYTAQGHQVVLSVKYSPPAGRDGDLAGYEEFVRSVIRQYGSAPGIDSFVIGNEANIPQGNPEASDGPFKDAPRAVVRGLIAAQDELTRMGSPARIGFNFAATAGDDGAFVRQVSALGGEPFNSAVDFVGINIYPGIWPPGTGDAYADMRSGLSASRRAIDSAPALKGRSLEVLEIGAPVLDEREQTARLTEFVRATVDVQTTLNVTQFNWFDLWDADSRSTNVFAHYGLHRSDLTPKPAFDAYRSLIAGA